jgi:hypothetical protein
MCEPKTPTVTSLKVVLFDVDVEDVEFEFDDVISEVVCYLYKS